MPAADLPLCFCFGVVFGSMLRRRKDSAPTMLGGFRNSAMSGHALGNGRSFPWRNLVQNRPHPPLSARSVVFGWPGKPVDEPVENGTLQESSTEEKPGVERSSCRLRPRAGKAGRTVPLCYGPAACAPRCTQNFASQCRNWSKAPARCLPLWW